MCLINVAKDYPDMWTGECEPPPSYDQHFGGIRTRICCGLRLAPRIVRASWPHSPPTSTLLRGSRSSGPKRAILETSACVRCASVLIQTVSSVAEQIEKLSLPRSQLLTTNEMTLLEFVLRNCDQKLAAENHGLTGTASNAK